MTSSMRTRTKWGLFGLLSVIVVSVHPGLLHVRAASLLLDFATAEGEKPWLPRTLAYAVDEEDSTLDAPTGETRARLYAPRGVHRPPALVIVPGVHRLGVEEPRLARFARAIAASGVVVFTPEIKELTEYRIDARSIGTIGAAAQALAAKQGRGRVGVMGMSFAGGLALLAAADPAFRDAIGFVVAVGAHHDMARVARFFVTDAIVDAQGATLTMKAHDYGLLVLVHDHVEDFFAPEDAPGARDAIRRWLWGEEREARALAEQLGEGGRAKLGLLFDKDRAAVGPAILEMVQRREREMRAVSPAGRLASIAAPVYLLHGAADSVIPPTETSWLEREVPAPFLRSALVSPAIQHVELHGEPTASERWALVHFMAQILSEASRDL